MTKTSDELWHEDKRDNAWEMPAAPWWKRLWGIRHIRAAYHAMEVDHWNQTVSMLGMIPSGYDRWVVYGIRRGWERKS